MNQKVMSYVLLVCAAISYARSIYFDSHFLVQFSIMNLIAWCMWLLKHVTKNQFRDQIAWWSITMVVYWIAMSVLFLTIDRYLIRWIIVWWFWVGWFSFVSIIRTKLISSIRGPIWRTMLSICVVVWLRLWVNFLFFDVDPKEEQVTIFPTYDRITTFSTWQTLTWNDRKTIIATGILPISGQSYFQFYDTVSNSQTTK